MDGQTHPLSITDFVRNVRREAEAAAEAELLTVDLDCCDSCHQQCPENEFLFGSYRSDLCRSCVKRITEDKKNKRHPATRLARDIRRYLVQASVTRPERLVDKLEATWEHLLDLKEANDGDVEYMNSILQGTTMKTIDAQWKTIDELKRKILQLTENNRDLQDDKERLHKGIDLLKQDNEKRQNVIESLGKIRDALDKDNSNLMQLKGTIQDEVASIRKEVQRLEEASLVLNEDRTKNAQRAEELEKTKEEVRKELEREKAEHNQLRENIKTALGL